MPIPQKKASPVTTGVLKINVVVRTAFVSLLLMATCWNTKPGLRALNLVTASETSPTHAVTPVPMMQANRTATATAVRKFQDNWPGLTPSSELGHPLVRIGHSFVDNVETLFREQWEEFLKVYQSRPDRNNICGMRINHAYALYMTVKQLKPTTIVESGVNAGQSTYLMRHAAPESTRIYAIDPSSKPICNQAKRWIDDSGKTTYWTGENFLDIQKVDWKALIDKGEIDPNTTLIFQDDHTNGFEHVLTYIKHGFRHILVEDNYRPGEGGNQADKAGYTPKQLLARSDADTQFFYGLLESYHEFPPLLPPSLVNPSIIPYRMLYDAFLTPTTNLEGVHAPLFRPDLPERREKDQTWLEEVTNVLDYDPKFGDKYSFFEFFQYVHICYFSFKPSAFVGPFLTNRMEVVTQVDIS